MNCATVAILLEGNTMNKLIIALIAGATAMSAAQAQNTPGSAYVGASAVTAKNQTVDAHKADAKLFTGMVYLAAT